MAGSAESLHIEAVPQKKILCVGLNCVDIVSVCDGYPLEDSDQRDIEQRWQRGGNASNSSSVLALLGAQAVCMATVAESHEKQFIMEDFKKYGIDHRHCVLYEGKSCPVSVIIINKNNGSRTIIHSNKNLPEITLEDFKKIDLKTEKFSWIHFEGRKQAASETVKIMSHIDEFNESLLETRSPQQRITMSVEIEKSCEELDVLFGRTDYTFISKEYAMYKGCSSKEAAVQSLINRCRKGSTVICAWGEDGAAAIHSQSKDVDNPSDEHTKHLVSVPVHPPPKVVDTLGAGDTFNAATIYSLCHGHDIKEAIAFGCKVAGTKCGIQGFHGLRNFKFT